MSGSRGVGAARGVPTVFLGTGSFAVPVLDALSRSDEVRVAGIVTGPPSRAGRGERVSRSRVAEHANALALAPILEPVRLRDPAAIDAVRALRPDLIVLADYGQIVPAALLGLPRHGALNLHPSLLPRHRGAAPIPAAILAGDRQTGVTVMLMDQGLDTGPIIAQVPVPLQGDETAPGLAAELAGEAAALLLGVLPDWLGGRLDVHPQPSAGATLTRPLHRADGLLDPHRTAEELQRQVRAYQPWPGTFAESVAGRLIVWAALPIGRLLGRDTPPGLFVPHGDGLALVVADGALRLDEVQLAGRRRMTSAELRRGHPELVGSRLRGPALP